MQISGSNVVITGGSQGIGEHLANAFAKAGGNVLVVARSEDKLRAVAERIGGDHLVADLTDADQVDGLVQACVERMGHVDIWVNNAGGLPDGTPRYLTRTERSHWQAQVDLNLTAVWEGAVVAARHMGDGGSIINISSETARGAANKNGPYAASKAAVNSLTQTLSVELAPAIRVNAVSPGPIPTENFIESVGYEGDRKEMIDKQLRIPLRRIGDERDIGSACVFLASPAASWITGQVLLVNGGR